MTLRDLLEALEMMPYLDAEVMVYNGGSEPSGYTAIAIRGDENTVIIEENNS